jgi:hypothetical protein
MSEHFDTGSKIGRGMAQASIDLIKAMKVEAETAQPITGRGIGYKLFARGLIPSMAKMASVYRLLKLAREQGTIPWEWIVDETREVERVSSWDNPAEFVRTVSRSYRRDYWAQQPKRIEVWSEKGTVRGVLAPILDNYGVGFRALHGFNSATQVHDIAEDDDGERDFIALYVGDYDPSGMYMSERDLPKRLDDYGGYHVTLKRVALQMTQVRGLLSFPASDKRKDPRYKWFLENYGTRCWELDAVDPNRLRELVRKAIRAEIEWDAWQRCATVERAERESMRTVLDNWKGGAA